MRVLVLGAGGPAGSGFCRALRMADVKYRLIGANTNPWDLRAAPVDERILVTPDMDLLDIVESAQPDFVHAQPEQEVARLSERRSDIEALGVRTSLPDHIDIANTQDKLATAKLLGPLAPEVTNEGDLWIRPRSGAGGKGARRGRDELTWGKWMAQRYVKGTTHTWQALYRDGHEIWSAARDTLAWTHGDRGSSAVVRTSDDERLEEVGRGSILKVAARRPNGPWSVDMLRDEQDQLWVTEINAGRFKTTTPEMYAALDQNIADWYVTGNAPHFEPVRPGLLWIRQWDQKPWLVHETSL